VARRSVATTCMLGGMSRRDFLKLGGAGLAGAALLGVAGCGGSTEGGEGAGGKVQLTLWHQEQPPNRVQQFQKVIDAFNESQKDIQVRQQVQNWENAYQKTTSAIQAGNPPDLQFTIPDFTVAIKETGAVQPVEDIVSEIENDHPFIDSAEQPYVYDDNTWAVPLFGMIQVLWYRKDMFEAAGLDPDQPPQDWDQLLAYAEQLTGDGKYGIGIPSSKHLYTDQEFYTFMITNGGKELFTADGAVNFEKEPNVETMAFYKELSEFSPPGSNSWTWAEPQAALNNGTLAMAIEKGQFLGPFEEESGQPASALGAAPVPWTPGGERGSIYYSNGVMLLTDDPEKKEAATQFLKFMFEPDTYANVLLAEPGLFLPVTQNEDLPAWRDSEVLSKYPEAVNLLIEQSRYGHLFGFVGDTVPTGIGQISAENLLSQAVQKAIVENQSAEAAVAWGQQQMEEAAS
jgi:multiple sugar transport system substrate-binding protein